jgi:hypothetical protein
MSNPSWPGDLPQTFQFANYDETWAVQVVRTNMEVGPAKIRRRGPNVELVNGEMICTRTQVLSMKTFFNVTLAGGALPFDWATQRAADAGVTHTYRFLSPPHFITTMVVDTWIAQLKLEVLP